MKLDELQAAIGRMQLTVVVFASIASLVAISSVYAVFRAQATLERSINERAVMVVPGAVAGEYIAGLSEENLKGVARYVGQLGTSFNTANFRQRMDELLSFADAGYLPSLTNETRSLEAEVIAQSQGRYFLHDTASEKLSVMGPNDFEYTTTGAWSFAASGLPLTQDIGRVTVRFKLGQPDQRNKYGFKIIRFSAVRVKGGAQ